MLMQMMIRGLAILILRSWTPLYWLSMPKRLPGLSRLARVLLLATQLCYHDAMACGSNLRTWENRSKGTGAGTGTMIMLRRR